MESPQYKTRAWRHWLLVVWGAECIKRSLSTLLLTVSFRCRKEELSVLLALLPHWDSWVMSHWRAGNSACALMEQKQYHIKLFQAEIEAILNSVSSYQRKKLVKEQTTICTDNQAATAGPTARTTKSRLVADSTEKLTRLSEENQVTIMLTPEHSNIEQNETAATG